VAAALGQAGQGFAATFAGGGQLSINTLVSQMVESVETLCESRLSTVLWMEKVKRLNAGDVEGWSSHTSTHLALSLLVGTDRLYVGGKSGGLADIVSGVAPDIDRRVRARFEAAIRSMRGLGAPLEAVVRNDRAKLEAAVQAVKELEIALKADLASALGVTLTFTSTDGD
jgi:predicted lipoprotein